MPQIGVLAKEGIEQLQNYVLSMQNKNILKIEKKQERIPLVSLMNRQLKQSSL
jgi:hypothetical protein